LEIDQKTEAEAGGSQVVEALRGVAGGEAIHTFHFDYEKILDEEVGKVLADRVALVADRQGSLGGGPNATEGQFPQ
jgi:hypothetical protein